MPRSPGAVDRRPLAVTASVAVGSIGLLAAALWWDWLGEDAGRGATFCEAARDGLLLQPANSLSNLGFVVAGLAIAARAGRPGALGLMRRAQATWMAVIVVLLGPGSAAMHATQSLWGGHLDLLSMYLVAAFASAYGWARWARRPEAFPVALVAGVVLCELVGLWSDDVPVVQFSGNLAFGALLLVAVGFEVALWRRGETRIRLGYGVAALAAMVVAFVVWLLGQRGWCDPDSWLQAHGVWHLLGAVAAYLLFRLYASEEPR